MTLEHQERDTIYWKDRWYTKSNGTESDDYADWNGVSQGSRTYVNGDTFQYLPMAACVNNPLMVDNGRLFYDSNYPGDSGCGFDYTELEQMMHQENQMLYLLISHMKLMTQLHLV